MLVPPPPSTLVRTLRPHSPLLRRLALAAGVVTASAFAPAAPASAASLAIAVPEEVLSSTPFTVSVSAKFETAAYVEVKFRPVGANCAATAAADPGAPVLDRSATELTFAQTANVSADVAGVYVVCAWARDTTTEGTPVVAAATATLNVRRPRALVSISVPSTVLVDELFNLSVTASSEVASSAYAGVVPDLGKGCPATYDALQKTAGSVPILPQTGAPVPAQVTVKESTSLPAKGKYLACAYMHRGPIVVAPEGAATTAFAAGLPCVVPTLKNTTLKRAKKLLTKAGCRLGKAKKAKSRTVKKGRVVRTGKKAGTELAPNTAIGVVVSKGR